MPQNPVIGVTKNKFNAGEISDDIFVQYHDDHACKRNPADYEKEHFENVLSTLNPLNILKSCAPITNNVSWCITELRSKLDSPSWLKRLHLQCCRSMAL